MTAGNHYDRPSVLQGEFTPLAACILAASKGDLTPQEAQDLADQARDETPGWFPLIATALVALAAFIVIGLTQ